MNDLKTKKKKKQKKVVVADWVERTSTLSYCAQLWVSVVVVSVVSMEPPTSQYRDKQFYEHYKSPEEHEQALEYSSTLYLGNLSFFTTEEQIYELFSKAGDIKRIIMGLDRVRKTPCGFCFVEYFTREEALACMNWINGSKLDDRLLRSDWDAGFFEGRQYGRGKHGGQVRDEYRTDFDPCRGGYGKIASSSVLDGGSVSDPPQPISLSAGDVSIAVTSGEGLSKQKNLLLSVGQQSADQSDESGAPLPDSDPVTPPPKRQKQSALEINERSE